MSPVYFYFQGPIDGIKIVYKVHIYEMHSVT